MKKLSRRHFLRLSAMGVGAAVISVGLTGCKVNASEPDMELDFLHGVASGDPLQDKVIIWTRVTPKMAQSVTVSWEVATDAIFTNLVTTGSMITTADSDFTVKVDAIQLAAATKYYYRFKASNKTSVVGETKTLPESNVEQVKLAAVSCTNFPAGFFNVYKEVAKISDLDAVLHLGDYIYEYERGGFASEDAVKLEREVLPATELFSLNDYRTRYAQYRGDEDLQTLHQALPFITIWDDHEVANDTWKEGADNHNSGEGDFTERKLAALQAYFEWLPIRPVAQDNQLNIHRSFAWGNLVGLHMLDTRIVARDEPLQLVSYVDPTTGVFDSTRFFSDASDTNRTLLGTEQLQWLESQIMGSTATWQVLGQQVLMGKMELPAAIATLQMSIAEFSELGAIALLAGRANAGDPTLTADEIAFLTAKQSKLTADKLALLQQPNIPYNPDAWDGYSAERETLLSSVLADKKNLVVLAGDTHNAWANNLRTKSGETVGVEFATSSVSSPGLERPELLNISPDNAPTIEAGVVSLVEDLQYTNLLERGFMVLTFTDASVTTDYLYVSTVKSRDYTLMTNRNKSFTVNAGDNKIG